MAEDKEKESAVIRLTEPPPQYTFARDASGKTRRTTFALSVHSATATTLIIAMVIFGGLYYHHLMKHCVYEEETDPAFLKRKTEVSEYGHRQVLQETEFDHQKELEVIRFTSPGADVDGSVVVIDYKRSVTGMYTPLADECYIIGGVDHHFTSPFQNMDLAEDNKEVLQEQRPPSPDVDESTLYYQKADDYKVTDSSILPHTLRPYCLGKPIYWLERTTKPKVTQVRVRRSMDRSMCVWTCRGRFCRWVCPRQTPGPTTAAAATTPTATTPTATTAGCSNEMVE